MAKIGLALLIVNNKILMFKRSTHIDDINPGMYGLLGGHIKDNETPLEGTRREVKEEGGLTLNDLVYVDNYKHKNEGTGEDDRLYVYAQELPNTDGIYLNPEHTDFKLFKPEQLTDPKIIPTTKFMYHDYINKFPKKINEQHDVIIEQEKKKWYHGTPDAREIETAGGFFGKTMNVDYVTDPIKYNEHQTKMMNAREKGDMDTYHKLLHLTPNFKKTFTYKKPLFLSDNKSVAKTYADPMRSFDYQSAIEKIYEVEVICNNSVQVSAIGDKFRFINIDKVKKGFINSGVSENNIDELISMFNYYITDNKGIKTDVIVAIANYLGFDCVDVIGVLDSYHGGSIISTVRVVLDPTKVKILKK